MEDKAAAEFILQLPHFSGQSCVAGDHHRVTCALLVINSSSLGKFWVLLPHSAIF